MQTEQAETWGRFKEYCRENITKCYKMCRSADVLAVTGAL